MMCALDGSVVNRRHVLHASESHRRREMSTDIQCPEFPGRLPSSLFESIRRSPGRAVSRLRSAPASSGDYPVRCAGRSPSRRVLSDADMRLTSTDGDADDDISLESAMTGESLTHSPRFHAPRQRKRIWRRSGAEVKSWTTKQSRLSHLSFTDGTRQLSPISWRWNIISPHSVHCM